MTFDEMLAEVRRRWGRASAYRLGLLAGELTPAPPPPPEKGDGWAKLYRQGIATVRESGRDTYQHHPDHTRCRCPNCRARAENRIPPLRQEKTNG